mmetsp:Transcript_584/g.1222  ORF Transcript_584/g.1222 Transcript_584/m.1222 type:complete len:210 (-) Transcript_584:154-783(-)
MNTSSTPRSATILSTIPSSPSYLSTTGIDSFRNVSNRFRMTSRLSSFLPDDLPLSNSRPVMISSGQSRNRTFFTTADPSAKASSHALTFPSLRGKPSMRNFLLPLSPRSFSMAFWRRRTVISLGTICPAEILALMTSASSEPLARSARSRSPADRCAHPRRSRSRSHCVPFPAPGPPRTKTTVYGSAEALAAAETFSSVFLFLDIDRWT